ncbi:hypothetical protein R5H30_21500 [Sulfitobacter sp. D35]|nr:hypothetical protein [Sulfitobacter sp. D35]MDW4500573.1 hypothetical protein [Sulfitobacter sp. D35]
MLSPAPTERHHRVHGPVLGSRPIALIEEFENGGPLLEVIELVVVKLQ